MRIIVKSVYGQVKVSRTAGTFNAKITIFRLSERIIMQTLSSELQARAAKIRLLIMDVDGVLTDGRIFIRDNGEEIKSFHKLDGHGLKMLQNSGVQTAIITGRDAPS